MKLQYEKDLEFYQKALDFSKKGITEVNSMEDFRKQLGDVKWRSKEQQTKYYSNFMSFRFRGKRVIEISIKSPKEIYDFIYKNMSDDDLIFNFVCFLRLYNIQSNKRSVVLTFNQISKIMGINPKYIYFKPYTYLPDDERSAAIRLENDIRAHLENYPKCKTIFKEINKSRKEQIVEAMKTSDTISFLKDPEEKEVYSTCFYPKTLSELGKAYDDENQSSFEPIDLTLSVIKNFYEHTGKSVTTKFLRVLLVLQRSGVIDLQVVKMGIKKNPDGTITERLLTNEEKGIYMDLKLQLAKEKVGYDNVKGKKDLERVAEFIKNPPFYFSTELQKRVPEYFPYDKIINVNFITFSKFGIEMLNDQYTSLLESESIQPKIIKRTKNGMKALKEQTLNNYDKRNAKRKDGISPNEDKLYRILTDKAFTVNLDNFSNALDMEWVEDLNYIPYYWFYLGNKSINLINTFESSENTIPASAEGIINKKLKEKIDSLADNETISEEDLTKIFEQANEESIIENLIY